MSLECRKGLLCQRLILPLQLRPYMLVHSHLLLQAQEADMFEVVCLSRDDIRSQTPRTSTNKYVSHEGVEPASLQVVLTHLLSLFLEHNLLSVNHAITPLGLHFLNLSFES